jgi:segregation and condensation protein A
MPYTVQLEKFEGPLDLLLQLIEDQKLPITEVSIARVTESYLRYLQDGSEIDARELADFLAVAAKLLLIKSREILPLFHWEDDEEDSGDLAHRLKIYKEYWEAAKRLRQLLGSTSHIYTRTKPILPREIRFSPPVGVTPANLRDFFEEVVRGLEPIVRLPKHVVTDTVTIQQKIGSIRKAILEHATVSFREMLADSRDRTEIIVSFLAILELVKQRIIGVSQVGAFDDITLHRVEADASTT